MRIVFFFIFFITVHTCTKAQCYKQARADGLVEFGAKQFAQAILTWQSALKYCDDKPDNHDLDTLIKQAEEAQKPPSFEPEMVFVKGSKFQMGSNSNEYLKHYPK